MPYSKRLANYRPVSLTSICCKLLEKLIRNTIVEKLEEQGLFNKNQHGFRNGRSCCTQLLEVMEMWTRWFDLGLPWDTIYTDFSKAFDSVPHQRLLHKIHACGIRGNLLKWIESNDAQLQGMDSIYWSKSTFVHVPHGRYLNQSPRYRWIHLTKGPAVTRKAFPCDDAIMMHIISSII